MLVIHEPGKPGACLKEQVTATLVALDGRRYVGTNRLGRVVHFCPRAGMPSFSNYEACKSVCQQPSHAEVSAIHLAGDAADGSTIYLQGHRAPCPDCVAAANAAGVLQIVVGDPPKL